MIRHLVTRRKSAPIFGLRRRAIGRTVLFLFITILGTIWLIPILFTVAAAIRPQADIINQGMFALPKGIHWQNFTDAWRVGRFSIVYRNSLFVTSLKPVLGILVASLAAFPLSKMRFRFSNALFFFFLLGLTVPVHVTLLPLSSLLRSMGLGGKTVSLFFPYIAFGLPLEIFVMRGFFNTIPNELLEAARVDGAPSPTIFWRIMLPLAKPALATLFITDVLSTWNEFLLALVLLTGTQNYTVPLGLAYFKGEFASNYGIQMAGVLIAIVPVLTVFLVFQRYIISGLTTGALKE